MQAALRWHDSGQSYSEPKPLLCSIDFQTPSLLSAQKSSPQRKTSQNENIPHFPIPAHRCHLPGLFDCVTTRVLAQTELPPVPPGAYYTSEGYLVPEGGGGVQPEVSGPPAPGTNTPGTNGFPQGCTDCSLPAFGTNLGRLIALAADRQTVSITLTNTRINVNYLLLVTTNLAGPWVTNQSILATSTQMVAAVYWTYDFPWLFFKVVEGPAPTPGTLKWSAFISTSGNDQFGSGLDASPAVSITTGEILITIANNVTPSNSMIFAVDPIYGEIQWMTNIFKLTLTNSVSFQIGEMTGSASVAPNGMIYVGGLDGNLYCLFPNGTTNWVRPAGLFDSIYSTPAIGSNGLIYVTSDEAQADHLPANTVTGVTAFNTNGTTNWFFVPQDLYYGNGGDVDSSPVVGADGSIYFLAEGSRLYALTAEGQLKWFLTIPGDTEPASTPALAPNGTIVVGSGIVSTNIPKSPYLYDVNPDGSLNWVLNVAELGGGNLIQCSPTIDQNGVIYTGSANLTADPQTGCLFAVNPNGTTKWIFTNSENYITSSPAVAADGTVYVGDEAFFYAVTNGNVKWFTNLAEPYIGSPAILPDGSLLFAGEDGNLYCLWGTTPVNDESPWPMFQQSLDHNGQQPPTSFTNAVTYNGAPFVFNGFYTGSNFNFSMTGVPGSSNWYVYASTNLAGTNWTALATNLTMNATTGNNSFTDSDVTGASEKFYVVSKTDSTSQTIGFYKQTIAPGTNLVADQLQQVDDNILFQEYLSDVTQPMNSLNSLFAISNAWGSAQSGTRIYKWNGTGFNGDTNAGPAEVSWVGVGDLTLLPGYSVLMNTTNTHSFTNTYVGLVRGEQIFQIQQTTNHSATTNYLSASVPAAGPLTTVSSYVPHNGDTIKLWSTTSSNYLSYPYNSNAWTDGAPDLAVGQGFLLITTNAETWTNTWQ
jgi:hypothetical protein